MELNRPKMDADLDVVERGSNQGEKPAAPSSNVPTDERRSANGLEVRANLGLRTTNSRTDLGTAVY